MKKQNRQSHGGLLIFSATYSVDCVSTVLLGMQSGPLATKMLGIGFTISRLRV